MYLFKRKGVYYLEYTDPKTNHKKRISTKTKNKNEALGFIKNLNEKLIEKEKLQPITLEDFQKQYSDVKGKTLSKAYQKAIKASFSSLGSAIGHKVLLDEITNFMLEEFLLCKFDKHPYLAANYYRTLKAAFNKAIEWGYIKNNPLHKVKLPRIKKDLPVFLNRYDLDKILSHVKDLQLILLYLFAFHTGLRRGEILNLRWNTIDFNDKVVKIKHTDDFLTKGKKERIVPFNEFIIEKLKEQFRKIKMVSIEQNEFVFCKLPGVKLNEDFVTKRFKSAVNKTKGIDKKVHFHTLRHSFASNLVQAGISLYVIKELLGHEDIKTTQIYSHLQTENLVDAVNILSNFYQLQRSIV